MACIHTTKESRTKQLRIAAAIDHDFRIECGHEFDLGGQESRECIKYGVYSQQN